ncbi:hypothetical protein FOZG_18100 [Fusarium oxysporum Fo47]|uniref:Uncharacterized protein n=1 Tax=Fusarium oxysporum Fo47 TaxID=660027 RepID=W9J814_FUSOX|nr:hypothetical protein FOZG_18141 [Fusarium oxysporum Fo47]EWZ28216.1 hypothetical protein FOZG_18100 [Fusarium oxysporum Fo47]
MKPSWKGLKDQTLGHIIEGSLPVLRIRTSSNQQGSRPAEVDNRAKRLASRPPRNRWSRYRRRPTHIIMLEIYPNLRPKTKHRSRLNGGSMSRITENTRNKKPIVKS